MLRLERFAWRDSALLWDSRREPAALALHHKTTPRGIYEKYMNELQQLLLKNDQTIPKVPNRDSEDLARTAAVIASSELGKTWAAANVINGFSHPAGRKKTNMWQSSPKESLPQWIELKLKEPSTIGAVQCTFDTDLDRSLGHQKEALSSVCVRDYRLEYNVNGQWKRVVRVRDNVQRFRRHQFSQVGTDRIRLTVEATHGAKTARLLEMRIYESVTPLVKEG